MTARLDLGEDDTARLDPDGGAVTQPVPPSRPRQQNDASLHDAVRARWREVVRRARSVDNTARLDLGVDHTARLDLGVDDTARLDPDTVKSLIPPPRPKLRNVASLHHAVTTRGGGEAVRPAGSVDDSRSFRLNRSIPILGILLILTATVRLINLTGSPGRFDDEGTYMAQAYAVAQWGELAHYTYWYDHPPAGWLQLALWTAISGPDFGGNTVAAGRYLMVIVAVITAALLWALARRIGMSRWAAAAAVAVFALSPLAISLSRMVYLDNLAVAWVLGALVLLCSPRYRLSAMFGAATCFGIAVLTKETMLLLLPMFAWLVWTRTAPATRRYALAVFVAVFGVVVSTYVLMAVLRGELVPGPGHVSLWEGIRFQLWDRTAGGALHDPYSLKRHTVDEWLRLDPALPFLVVPIALAALFVERLRPFAVGLVVLTAIILRPGYLPVPFILSALPLTALLAAGTGEAALRYLFRTVGQRSVGLRRFRVPALAAGALIVSIAVSLWLPTYHFLMKSDVDAPMRQAQQWIQRNVPKTDRLIVDDALWLDLIRDGRDRRNVVWAYKVDTDEQVQGWAPHGWTDYGWVVSTASLRANMPPTGVLADAVAHAQPAAIFDSGGYASRGAPRRQRRTDLETPVARGAGVRRATRGPPCGCHRSGYARRPAVSDGGSTCACDAGSDRCDATRSGRGYFDYRRGGRHRSTPTRYHADSPAPPATRCRGILRTPGRPVRSAVRGSDRQRTEGSISVAHQGHRSGRRFGAIAGRSGRVAGSGPASRPTR